MEGEKEGREPRKYWVEREIDIVVFTLGLPAVIVT